MFLTLDEERQKYEKMNTLGILGSSRPRNDPAGPGDMDGVQGRTSALPGAGMASGIPRIAILDENAVYDHYMRRLNRVWMRRIKVQQDIISIRVRDAPNCVRLILYSVASIVLREVLTAFAPLMGPETIVVCGARAEVGLQSTSHDHANVACIELYFCTTRLPIVTPCQI